MAKKGRVEMNLDKLKGLVESLKTKPTVQVGVFSNKTGRRDDMTNASLAAIHEFGDTRHGLPARSILITPLKDHAKEIMASVKGKAGELADKGKVAQLWKLTGIAAEKVILQAFSSGGFGKWAHLKGATILAKLHGSMKKRRATLAKVYSGQSGEGILIDTGELRRSFSSRVVMRFR